MDYLINPSGTEDGWQKVCPVKMSANSDEIAPGGCCIRSTCFIVDKMEVAICDGKDRWYIDDGKYIEAGQPWSGLF